ncbi:Hypothetical predicted protein [Cloeon dipterum]|uniref:CHK kinase-like domain-containing protein n=1 Tax=Cloeon dipterum TaxID=197152 RepID=A0A8S1CY94_9INSE|nr:Hypothetical predicted protein [Cloeon dipterum]
MDPIEAADIQSALQNLLGTTKDVAFEYEVAKGTEKLQGFVSLIKRAVVTYEDGIGEKKEVRLIVKMPPVSEHQLSYTKGSDFHQRECDFFNSAVPILERNFKNSPASFPLVKCYLANERAVILEDLCASRHEIVSKPLSSTNYCSLEYIYIEMVFQQLALFHSASVGTNWPKVLPLIQVDGLFEGHGRNMMEPRIKNGALFVAEVLRLEFPDAFKKYSEWLSTGEFYNRIVDLCKPSQHRRNCLCHGDMWENNVMFRFDKDRQPTSMKIIDLQMVRYNPPAFDLQFFMYLCTDKDFRDANEVPLLATYVDLFNRNLPESEPQMTMEDFLQEYEEFRLFGTLLAATMRPSVLLEGSWVSENDGEMNGDVVENFIYGKPVEDMVKQFKVDETFRWAIMAIVDELVKELDKTDI